jgi:hypothetical protein
VDPDDDGVSRANHGVYVEARHSGGIVYTDYDGLGTGVDRCWVGLYWSSVISGLSRFVAVKPPDGNLVAIDDGS